MKITVSQLKRIIKEEVSRMLHEEEKLMEDADRDKVAEWITNLSVTADDYRIPREPKYYEHYIIIGDNLGLVSNLYNAISGKEGKMDELLGLLPPGGKIQSYAPELRTGYVKHTDPVGSEYIRYLDLKKGPVDTYGPKQPSTPVPGSIEYYKKKKGLPPGYLEAMTTEGENKSKVRR